MHVLKFCRAELGMLLQVVCSGHSLGAALASICAVWASVQYPNADVLSVTIGQASLSFLMTIILESFMPLLNVFAQ